MKNLSLNLIKIASILNDGNYHDGNTIGKRLDITRAAVWKLIKKLENYDIELSSIKGKGYALSEPLNLIDEEFIKKNIGSKNIIVEVLETIDSTNQYLKKFLSSKEIRVCIAEHQSKGRGRFNRNWYSPFGKNIYLSYIYSFSKDISELAGLPLIISLSVINTLKQIGLPDEILVKWPNDVIYKNKKLSGSLIEIQAESNGLSSAIIGIGINVNMINDKGNINQAWDSLKNITNQYINRNQLSILLIDNLTKNLKKFDEYNLLPFINEFEKLDALKDKYIKLQNINNIISGYARGINSQGNLRIELDDGSIHTYSAGDITILPAN